MAVGRKWPLPEGQALCAYQSQVCTAEGLRGHYQDQAGVWGTGHSGERPGFPILRLGRPLFSEEQQVTELKGGRRTKKRSLRQKS